MPSSEEGRAGVAKAVKEGEGKQRLHRGRRVTGPQRVYAAAALHSRQSEAIWSKV